MTRAGIKEDKARPSIGKEEIRAVIPHAGSMCLLDAVLAWDDASIHCISDTHRAADNPLRRDGRLSALHAFEYGAQAVAVHGGLRARAAGLSPPFGYLAGLRAARLHVDYLNQIAEPLAVWAARVFGDTGNTIYVARVTAGEAVLAEARITIMLRTGRISRHGQRQ